MTSSSTTPRSKSREGWSIRPIATSEAQLLTNLAAPIELTRLVLPGMLERRRGAIVNVSSMSGKVATPYNAIYAATKHGLNGFTKSLRLELQGSGVHVGVVCPSFVADTGMWADTGQRAPALMREVKPEKVVRAVFAVLNGAGEVLVTPGPIRPLLVLREMFPSIEGLRASRPRRHGRCASRATKQLPTSNSQGPRKS